MNSVGPHLELEAPYDIQALPGLLARLEEFCRANGADDACWNSIMLAIEELLVNVIDHGAVPGDAAHLCLRATKEAASFRFEVEDHGLPFNPLTFPEPDLSLSVEERPLGGLGIFLVKNQMDELRYQRVGNLNTLTMTKAL